MRDEVELPNEFTHLHTEVERHHSELWEEYEEVFAADPYSEAMYEIGRAIHHALELGGSMSQGEFDILQAVAMKAAALDPVLLKSEHFEKISRKTHG